MYQALLYDKFCLVNLENCQLTMVAYLFHESFAKLRYVLDQLVISSPRRSTLSQKASSLDEEEHGGALTGYAETYECNAEQTMACECAYCCHSHLQKLQTAEDMSKPECNVSESRVSTQMFAGFADLSRTYFHSYRWCEHLQTSAQWGLL